MSAPPDLPHAHRRFGWSALLVFLLFGYVLEALEGFKVGGFLLDPIRHELWTLAHFHGAFLGMFNLVYAGFASSERLSARARTAASRALRVGSALLPSGFLLGGAQHFEGDPGFGIFLVPLGAILVLYTVAVHAAAAWRRAV